MNGLYEQIQREKLDLEKICEGKVVMRNEARQYKRKKD